MKKLLTAALMAGAVVCVAAPADAHYSRPSSASMDSQVHSCGFITFAPGTDNAAGDIKAGNMRCRSARQLVRRVSPNGRGPSGWTCQHRGRQSGDSYNSMAHTDFRCRSGRRFVTWMVT